MTEITFPATPQPVPLSLRFARWRQWPSPKHPLGARHRRARRAKCHHVADRKQCFAGLPISESASIIIPAPRQPIRATPKSP